MKLHAWNYDFTALLLVLSLVVDFTIIPAHVATLLIIHIIMQHTGTYSK